MYICNDCPRKCNAKREALTPKGKGFCRMGEKPVIARAALHIWEEPPISGTNGSGTVFFSGCNLQCEFCQNKKISRGNFGKEITVEELREIYKDLISQGAHNINLVTATHFLRAVSESLNSPLPVPVVYNSSGYEDVDSLKMLDGKIDIYLPDFKYADNSLAKRFSNADDYFEITSATVKEMYRQVGSPVFDGDGIMKRGVIIRHLVLPGEIENSKCVIDWVKNNFESDEVLFSLMSQFTPVCDGDSGQLNRRLTEEEYNEIADYLFDSGIENGFIQELSSASEEYVPPFDLGDYLE